MQTLKIKRYRVPVIGLQKHVDPLKGRLWGCDAITEAEIRTAVAARQFETEAWDSASANLQGPSGRDFHIRRVAHFVESGLPNDKHSIQLDLQRQPDGSEIGVMNGNHRIAAAIVRGDAHVEALLYVWDRVDISRLLPGAVET
ncbi:hypothetical protein [Acidocella sp.]|uniref:hypothetical protein n=1 Tax=Acidocella sp. TaxID=50710 RepID=UPI0017ADF7A4|nr:hypothetical protein [Acidocella sp.]NNM56231.1 hypothetical protein [Acidocella sp.]